jgi:NADH-quinone oxidoreductase subunit C
MSLVFSIVNIRDLINVSILGVWHSLNIINISLTSKNFVYSSCFLLKYHTLVRAILLTDVCVIDYPNKSLRFKIVYNILSIKYKMRYLLYCSCSQFETLSTLTPLFNNAG